MRRSSVAAGGSLEIQMALESYSKLSSPILSSALQTSAFQVSEEGALAAYEVAATVARPAVSAPALLSWEPVFEVSRKSDSALLPPLIWAAGDTAVSEHEHKGRLADPWIRAAIIQPDEGVSGPRPPKTAAAAGDVIATWIIEAIGLFYFIDEPNVDAGALAEIIVRVVRDICAHWKPGEDLIGKLRAGVGFAMWGAGVSPEKIAEVGNDIVSALAGAGTTPLELGKTLYRLV